MNAERWRRLQELFDEARELAPADRDEFLAERCSDDADLREKVASLIDASDRTETRSEGPVAAEVDRTPGPGVEVDDRIGPYRLLEKIGEGGMGEVYLAEQTEPVRRKVALKVIKAGMDTRAVVARFEAERQALALMDHRAVAKVFQAGATPRGRPYFAMEYVKGVPVTEHCDRNKLSNRQRLGLFRLICDGVQHAHQRAIIHRDLKPSNVLVSVQDGDAVPKIIDFGVAKATSQSLTEKTLHTQLGTMIGTPAYMSPEQAELTGQDVDTRTDVYSLGVMLYELLTGVLPFDSAELRGNVDGIRKVVVDTDPPTPSARLSTLGDQERHRFAERRRTDPGALRRQLRGELDWITMKALEKDRTRRYGSPAELAADIERHLRHEPVLAGPTSTTYRAGRFVRRHRVGVISVSTITAALIAGAILAGVGFVRADRARRIAERDAASSREVTAFLQEMLTSVKPENARGRDITVREILDSTARDLDGRFVADPEVEAAIRFAVGDSYQALADFDSALPMLRRAVDLRRDVLEPEDPRFMVTLDRLGMVYWLTGEFEGSLACSGELLEIRTRVYGPEHPETTQTIANLANTYADMGDLEKARELLTRVLTIERRTLEGEDRESLAYTINNLATVLVDLGEYDEAIELHRESLALRRRFFGDDSPEVVISMTNLGLALHGANRLNEAETALRDALSIGTVVLGPEHQRVASTHGNLARVLADTGRLRAAESQARRALEIHLQTVGERSWRTGVSRCVLATILNQAGRSEEAEAERRLGLDILVETLGEDHPRTRAAARLPSEG